MASESRGGPKSQVTELEPRAESLRRAAGESTDAMFRLLTESVRDHAVFLLDPKGIVETWNLGAQHFAGYAPDEIIGSHVSVLFPETDLAARTWERELEIASRTGRFEGESFRIRKDGTQLRAGVTMTPVIDSAGTLTGFATVLCDLTERHRSEERHRSDEERFRLLIESVQDYAIFLLDPCGKVSTWNAGAERFKGYKADEIIGSHFSRFYPEEDVHAGKCEMELAITAQVGRFEDEGWRVRKDGSRFWANVVITALRDGAGTLIGFGKVTRDLTERKAAEERRRAEEQRFGLLIGSVKDYALLILEPDGTIATWNAGAELIKGYTASEIVGSHFSRFYPREDVLAGKCERELAVAAEEGRFEDEGWRVRKDGTPFWANVVISAIRDDLGALVGYSKVTRDLTQRRRSEKESAAHLAAEQANRTKDEFLAMLGHELRNPLAPIVSALQLLKLSGDRTFGREHQVIERQVKHMTRLVDDLLDVSRISRGKIELKRDLIDLRDPLARAAEIAAPLIEKKKHQLEVRVPQAPLAVNGDGARLTQVFANLLTNAAKYTDEGGQISMTVTERDRELEIEVRDNGTGIEAALLPRVFELFVQGYQNVDRAEGGLGLGLTLVKSLVLLHGGSVEAHSGGGERGSRFLVRLPRAEQPLATKRAAPQPRITLAEQRHKILLVDDNEDARMLLAEMLVKIGHDVQTAHDGEAALVLLHEMNPDVAILDIGLPGMDGYELARRIRQLPGHGAIRLLALTGYGQQIDKANTRAAGFDVHLVKPIDFQRLIAHLAPANPP